MPKAPSQNTNKSVQNKETQNTNEIVEKVEVSNNDKNIDVLKELQDTKKKNEDLESKIDQLTEMFKMMLTQNQNNTTNKVQEEVKIEKKENKSIFNAYVNIDPMKRVLVVNMMNAAGTFTTYNNKSVRFEYFGHIQPIRFEDLESLVSKYRNYFENLELRILDEEAVDALYLREFYNKNNVSIEDMENIIDLEPQELVKKIKSLNNQLQESVLSLIIANVAKNSKKYMDKNKWDVINNAFNINIQDFANRYLI